LLVLNFDHPYDLWIVDDIVNYQWWLMNITRWYNIQWIRVRCKKKCIGSLQWYICMQFISGWCSKQRGHRSHWWHSPVNDVFFWLTSHSCFGIGVYMMWCLWDTNPSILGCYWV
jgi:hypothetical protein